MPEPAVLALPEAGVDRAPGKIAAQVRLAGLHPVKGFLQVPQGNRVKEYMTTE